MKCNSTENKAESERAGVAGREHVATEEEDDDEQNLYRLTYEFTINGMCQSCVFSAAVV